MVDVSAGIREAAPPHSVPQMQARTSFQIRDFEPSDQPQVVDLLRRVLDRPGPHVHDDAYFRWKHLENPFGSSIMYVAEADRRVIGFRAIMRWRLEAGGRIVEAGRPVDTVTDPSCRRQGVFSSLTKTALGRLEQLGITVLFNTPNEQSLPGYLKMGWTPIGRATRDVLIGGPGIVVRVALARMHRNGTSRSASSGASLDASRVAAALKQRRVPGARIIKDHAYVLWRYAQHPWFRYRVVCHGDAAAVVRVARG
ncbi:MAG: GNAT family N-acetyltransferase, partial [Armatimonadota bacterium]